MKTFPSPARPSPAATGCNTSHGPWKGEEPPQATAAFPLAHDGGRGCGGEQGRQREHGREEQGAGAAASRTQGAQIMEGMWQRGHLAGE